MNRTIFHPGILIFLVFTTAACRETGDSLPDPAERKPVATELITGLYTATIEVDHPEHGKSMENLGPAVINASDAVPGRMDVVITFQGKE